MTTDQLPGTTRAVEVDEVGRIVFDKFEEGLRFIVMRGPAAWCAYIGIPEDHPLAGFSYDDLPSVDAHGGLTYAGKSTETDKWRTAGYYWYGWDYAHLGDMSVYDHRKEMQEIAAKYPGLEPEHDWTIDEVVKDAWGALYDFKKLLKFAEAIKAK